jgi:hypothetical protein
MALNNRGTAALDVNFTFPENARARNCRRARHPDAPGGGHASPEARACWQASNETFT